MPYNAIGSSISPHDDRMIWRYLEFPRLVAMLYTSTLHFSSIEVLRKLDPFEGYISRVGIEHAIAHLPAAKRAGFENMIREWPRLTAQSDKFLLVNCWHANESESAAMWKVYADKGVAIQSTIKRLQISLAPCEHDVFLQDVEYTDQRTRLLTRHDFENVFPRIHRKDLSFQHEKEVRASCFDPVIPKLKRLPRDGECSGGCEVPVDLTALIKRVVVAPRQPPWFHTIVAETLQRCGVEQHPEKSYLDIDEALDSPS